MGCKCVTCVNQETDKDNPNELFNKAALKHLTKPTPFKEETNNDSMPLCTNQSSIKFQTHQSSFELPKKELTFDETPEDEYSNFIFEHINKVRKDPSSMIPILESSMCNIKIKRVRRGGIEEDRLIYESKVKVALVKGKKAFKETIEYLKQQQPISELLFDKSLCTSLPSNEDDLKDKIYLSKHLPKDTASYWRDIVRDEETSFILMVVDDNGKEPNRRFDIFNKEYKRIGIVSKRINKTFAAYFIFSK